MRLIRFSQHISEKPAAMSSRVAISCVLAMVTLCLFSGCSRKFWRKQADDDTYRAVSEKLTDERWHLPRMDMTPDVRSRFYDPYDPDSEPLPPDDPTAHQFMHCVNGKQGSKGWHKFGDALSIENPHWLEPYQVLLNGGDPVNGHAEVEIPRVTLRDSVDLTYIHSREYQTGIEEVYLRALDVTLERYALGTQFQVLGGNSGVGGGVVSARQNRNGPDTASLQNGIGVTQLLPAGANIAVNVLNTITWNTSSGSGTATRLAWQITQPFMRGGGRQVIMEALTQAERSLLYEVRTLALFRQTLFTGVASDYLRIMQQIQNIENLKNNIRQLEEQIEVGKAKDNRVPKQVTEPVKVFPQNVNIPDDLKPWFSYDERLELLRWKGPLSEQQRDTLLQLSDETDYQAAIQQLIRWKEMNVVSLSVAQLITRLNGRRNDLENAGRVLADLLDSFKIRLGLPPNVQMEVDPSLLLPFQLIDPRIVSIENDLKDLARKQGPGLIPEPTDADSDQTPLPDFQMLKKYVANLGALRDRTQREGLELVRQEFVPVRDLLRPAGTISDSRGQRERYFLTPEEKTRVVEDVGNDLRLFRINERDFARLSNLIDRLEGLLEGDSVNDLVSKLDQNNDGKISRGELPSGWSDFPRAADLPDDETISGETFILTLRDATIGLREDLLQIAQSLQVIQAGLRVEVIALNRFQLPGRSETPNIEEVVQLGLQNRHDLMNARARVTDARRAVEVAANALMSVMNLGVGGTVDPDGSRNNGVDFTLEFKAPLDQVLERNVYREAQVEYQRERRDYMLLEDQVKRAIRASWRQLKVSEQQLEIDRQTVRIAALQYDNAALEATGAGQTNSLSLLNALDAVLRAQDDLVSDWITYETNRLNIFRDMGIMEIDSTGVWEDSFYQLEGQTALDAAETDFPLSLPEPTELTPQPQSVE